MHFIWAGDSPASGSESRTVASSTIELVCSTASAYLFVIAGRQATETGRQTVEPGAQAPYAE